MEVSREMKEYIPGLNHYFMEKASFKLKLEARFTWTSVPKLLGATLVLGWFLQFHYHYGNNELVTSTNLSDGISGQVGEKFLGLDGRVLF